MTTILISNDDGVYSPGLLALKQTLGQLGDVHVIAPDRNRSAVSHTKTMNEPVRVHQVELADGSTALACTGGPADCVALAAGGLLGNVPDLVVGGINDGYNLDVDVSYSGTVACAKEAVVNGIAGMAVSTNFYDRIHEAGCDVQVVLADVAAVALQVAARLLSNGSTSRPEHALPRQTLFNLNVPGVPRRDLRGVRITRLGGRTYREELVERRDPRGRPYYWIGSRGPMDAPEPVDGQTGNAARRVGSDVDAVRNNFASITPITLDMTDYNFLTHMSEWTLSGIVE